MVQACGSADSGCRARGNCGRELPAYGDVAQSEAPMVRAVERLKLKAGWLVARDCGGLIVRRHIEPDGATAALDRTSTITLN